MFRGDGEKRGSEISRPPLIPSPIKPAKNKPKQ
jgi:hypothetical protein